MRNKDERLLVQRKRHVKAQLVSTNRESPHSRLSRKGLLTYTKKAPAESEENTASEEEFDVDEYESDFLDLDDEELEESESEIAKSEDVKSTDTKYVPLSGFLMKKRNKYVAALLGLVFTVLSGFYITISGTILQLTLVGVSILVFTFFGFYAPWYYGYVLGVVFAVYNYRFVAVLNESLDNEHINLSEVNAQEYLREKREIKSGLGVSYGMGGYNWYVSIFILCSLFNDIYESFSTGHYWLGLFVILTIPVVVLGIYWILGFVESLLMLLINAGYEYSTNRYNRKLGFNK